MFDWNNAVLTSLFIYISTVVFGSVVWAIRLEGRTQALAVRHEALKELIESKLDGVNERLDRIERLIINGSRKITKVTWEPLTETSDG